MKKENSKLHIYQLCILRERNLEKYLVQNNSTNILHRNIHLIKEEKGPYNEKFPTLKGKSEKIIHDGETWHAPGPAELMW